jgi:hypothetical protein
MCDNEGEGSERGRDKGETSESGRNLGQEDMAKHGKFECANLIGMRRQLNSH